MNLIDREQIFIATAGDSKIGDIMRSHFMKALEEKDMNSSEYIKYMNSNSTAIGRTVNIETASDGLTYTGYVFDESPWLKAVCMTENKANREVRPKNIKTIGRKTFVEWNDGTTTKVTCDYREKPDPFMAFCAAYTKKMFGSTTKVMQEIDKADEQAKRRREKEENKRKNEIRRKKDKEQFERDVARKRYELAVNQKAMEENMKSLDKILKKNREELKDFYEYTDDK